MAAVDPISLVQFSVTEMSFYQFYIEIDQLSSSPPSALEGILHLYACTEQLWCWRVHLKEDSSLTGTAWGCSRYAELPLGSLECLLECPLECLLGISATSSSISPSSFTPLGPSSHFQVSAFLWHIFCGAPSRRGQCKALHGRCEVLMNGYLAPTSSTTWH